MLRPLYNITVVFMWMIFVFVCGFMLDIFVRDRNRKLKYKTDILHFATKTGTKMIGIKVNANRNFLHNHPYFIVSNHLSYLDIVIIASLYKTVFVSTTEVRSSSFFGRLSSYAGAVFIDRKNRFKVKEDMENIKEILQNGVNVSIFLEGTTSNGCSVLPFKSSFLEVVFNTNKPVIGLCIRYRSFNSKPIDEVSRDIVYYYADNHRLITHIFKFLTKLKSLEVDLDEVGVFLAQDYSSRKEMANDLHKEISAVYAS